MKDFLDFIKNFWSSIEERIRIPFLNSLIISWIIINWKIVLILLFSERAIESRIHSIVSQYSSPWENIFYPLTAAFVYVVGMPFALKGFHSILVKIKQKNWEDQADYKIFSFERKIKIAEKERELQLKRAENMTLDELNSKREVLEAELIKKTNELNEVLNSNNKLNRQIGDSDGTISKLYKERESIVDFNSDLFNKIEKEFSFKNHDEIDGLKILNFVNRLLNQLFRENSKYVDYKRYLIELEEQDLIHSKGFSAIKEAIQEGDSKLDSFDNERINFAMDKRLIFSFEKEGEIFYGLTYKGIN